MSIGPISFGDCTSCPACGPNTQSWREISCIVQRGGGVDFTNIQAFANTYDMTSIPWGYVLYANFSSSADTSPSSTSSYLISGEIGDNPPPQSGTTLSPVGADAAAYRVQYYNPIAFDYSLMANNPANGLCLLGCQATSAHLVDMAAYNADASGGYIIFALIGGSSFDYGQYPYPAQFPTQADFLANTCGYGYDPDYATGSCSGTSPENP